MPDEHLPPDAIGAIVEAFQAFPGLADERLRRSCANMLREDLCVPLSLEPASDPMAEIGALVRTAARHWGGLESLMDGLGLGAEELEDDEDLRRLRSVVLDLVALPVLQVQERASLRKLLLRAAAPEPDRLRRIRQAVAPHRQAPAGAESLHDVLWELDEMPAFFTPVRPLLVLVEILRREWTGDVAESALVWTQQLASRFRLPWADVENSVRAAVERLEATPFLIADLDDSDGERQLRFSLYLWYSSDDQWTVLHDDGEPRTAGQIGEFLSHTLNQNRELPHRDLVIEFAVPGGLVNWAFDQLPHDSTHLPLGVRYPVTVRVVGVELMQDATNISSRQAKQHWYATHGHEANPQAVFWDPRAEHVAMWAELVNRPECVCVVLPAPPAPTGTAAWQALGLALSAGALAVIWNRKPQPPPLWEDQLVKRLRETPVREHLETVRKVRIDARGLNGGPRHAGSDLSLCRDDGNRRRPPPRTRVILPY